MNTRVIKKIQKLLALSESSNEHEAQLAMVKAQELLIKHKLLLKEVKETKVYNSMIKEKISNISFKKAKWKAHLAEVISDNFGCYYFFKTRFTHTITFFGREEDVIICNIVLDYAIDCINNKVKTLRYKCLKNGKSSKGLENDYAIGFINGLNEAFKKQKETNKKWALVLLKDKEVTNAYNNIEFKREIDTNLKLEGFRDEFFEGIEDGKNFSITDKIENDGKDELFLITEKLSE